MIYAVAEGNDRTAVKIGFTESSIDDRIAGLQTGNPRTLVCIALAPGSKFDELALHSQFAAHRIRGEWFRMQGDVAKWVCRHASGVLLTPTQMSDEQRERAARRIWSSRNKLRPFLP